LRILVAEDDLVSRHALEGRLRKWGYEVAGFADGTSAWEALQAEDAPRLVILDWLMPGLDGIEICGKMRAEPHVRPAYIILLTARTGRENVIQGLDAGADDYVTKPFDFDELRARVQVGVRVVELQNALSERVRELEEALSRVKQLQGLLPICSYCKKIRDDRNYWQQVEGYISEHSEAQFSHGICPECFEKYVKPELESLQKEPQKQL
jgi:sigma-B regulation protein RsbU (phosphoserine phosphatase)